VIFSRKDRKEHKDFGSSEFLALCPRFAVCELIWISLELSSLCI
jgi:hypothetical protein